MYERLVSEFQFIVEFSFFFLDRPAFSVVVPLNHNALSCMLFADLEY